VRWHVFCFDAGKLPNTSFPKCPKSKSGPPGNSPCWNSRLNRPIPLARTTTILLNPKEAPMQYKSIILELLQQRPQMYDQLRENHQLLKAVEAYASDLKRRHNAWKTYLARPEMVTDRSLIASVAMELASEELESSFPTEYPLLESEPLSLDAAMAFIRHSPPA
jgi:hypothetical protein